MGVFRAIGRSPVIVCLAVVTVAGSAVRAQPASPPTGNQHREYVFPPAADGGP